MTTAVALPDVELPHVELPDVDLRGRTQVSGRALRSVAAAAAAVALGVPRKEVHVELSDDGGRLAFQVRAPVVVAAGAGTGRDGTDGTADDPGDTGGTVVRRAEAARQQVARALTELGGAGVGSCRLVVTAVTVTVPGRVGNPVDHARGGLQ